jgi:DNA polymerase-3 subunit epsilon
MLDNLSLRLRVFLFFALIGIGGVVLFALALYFGFEAAQQGELVSAFLQAGIIAGFGLMGMVMGIWLLFDENVAKPIERVAARMRAGAHAGVNHHMDMEAAKYLGDLGPAAEAVTRQLIEASMNTAGAIATKTQKLELEKERLTKLLTEIPLAMILVNSNHQIVLYDGQAASVLAQIQTPRLNADIFDYFERKAVEAAWETLMQTGEEVTFRALGSAKRQNFEIRMKPLDSGTGYMLIIESSEVVLAPDASRPLIYDFGLLEQNDGTSVDDLKLSELTYCVFDTETTGLLPHKDEMVQIGAVRVVRNSIVVGEEMSSLVNPQVPIPSVATNVHGITDAMVAGAPSIEDATRNFHDFARSSVLVAHNAPFDMAFMHRYGKRVNLDWPHPVLDTALASAVVFGASEDHTVDALCTRLGVEIPPAVRHTALGDARATAEVLCRLIPMLEARGIETFGDLLTHTRKHGRILKDLN